MASHPAMGSAAQGPLPIAEPVALARPRWVRAGAPGIAARLTAGIGALAFAIAALLPLGDPRLALFDCPFRAATGLPCLGCGGTHAFVHLAHGRLGPALAANPLWTLGAALLWGGALFSLARLAGLRWTLALPRPSAPRARALRFALFAAAAANWAFVALQR